MKRFITGQTRQCGGHFRSGPAPPYGTDGCSSFDYSATNRSERRKLRAASDQIALTVAARIIPSRGALILASGARKRPAVNEARETGLKVVQCDRIMDRQRQLMRFGSMRSLRTATAR